MPSPPSPTIYPPRSSHYPDPNPAPDALLVLLPLLIVLSTFLFLLLVFLICVLLIRRRRGISLHDNVGPVDMSREELIEGEGGFEGVESRWLESVPEHVRRDYVRARGHLHPVLLSRTLLTYFQTINCTIHPIPCPRTSHYRSSSLSRKKAYQPGHLSQITKPSTLSSFMPAPRLPSSQILRHHPAYSPTSPYPN